MRTIIVLCTLALLTGPLALAQEGVPSKVKKAFQAKFPQAAEVEWGMDDENHEAEFEMNGQDMSAVFDKSGTWLETETEIAVSDLPAAVRESLGTLFKDCEADEAERVETPDGPMAFEVEIECEGEDMEVLLSEDGTVLKKQKEDADENNEDGDED